MGNRMHANSLDTYREILETLPSSRANVLSAIKAKQPITRQGISRELGWTINRVTGRVRELLDVGVIREEGTQITPTRRPRALLVLNLDPQEELF